MVGRADPLGNYTSATYDANGLPTQITYGDNDSNPATVPTDARTVYMFYDSTYPGRIAEVRRNSDLAAPPIACSATNTSGCARTLYTYGTDTTLQQMQQVGDTLDSTGTVAGFTYTTAYSHNTRGQVTEIDGPVTGMKTVFDYYTSSDPMKDGYLQDDKIALRLIAAAAAVPFIIRYLRARRAEAQARELENVDTDVVIVATEVQPIPANAPIGPGLG